MSEALDLPDDANVLELTAGIVCNYLKTNRIEVARLPDLIRSVYCSLVSPTDLVSTNQSPEAEAPLVPAVPVRLSVFPDYIICLEDGRKVKLLRRHLMARHGMTPAAYRAKWSLPAHYPFVAPNYSRRRSALAVELGLGGRAQESRKRGESAKGTEPAVSTRKIPEGRRGRARPPG